jgi:hypothetical protein
MQRAQEALLQARVMCANKPCAAPVNPPLPGLVGGGASAGGGCPPGVITCGDRTLLVAQLERTLKTKLKRA